MRSELLTQLRAAGIIKLECDYSGYGDDGQINGINVEGGNYSEQLDDALMDFFWDITQDHFEGFHNDDGGHGTITWDVVNDKLVLHHAFNETVSTYVDPIEIETEEEEDETN